MSSRNRVPQQQMVWSRHTVYVNAHLQSSEVGHERYRFNVTVVASGRVVFGCEVYYRHQVSDEKAAGLCKP